MRTQTIFSFFLMASLTSPAYGRSCEQYYWKGQSPVITDAKMLKGSQPLCKNGYALMHSALTKTPLWSAEHLTAEKVQRARKIRRQSEFFEEPELPKDQRASLADYKSSGFDRGHLTPSGDMPSLAEQQEAFSLANMVPQAPELNRDPWQQMERAVRLLVEKEQEAYVLTGPLFEGQKVRAIGNKVLVPTHIWKTVYFPTRQQVGVYLAVNQNNSGPIQVITLSELESRLKINLYPTLSESIKRKRVEMPLSTSRTSSGTKKDTKPSASTQQHQVPAADQPKEISDADWIMRLLQLLKKLF